ncbi:MAG: DNA repair protein RecN [Bacteroidales bacterium]|nr:DNA repair protein RecN [Bacteroidales bacterium]
MLTHLHIENYALIRESDIDFEGGFVVITGETGAGKSILLGALSLLLGQRADTQVLREKDLKCVVEAAWNVESLGLEPYFEANELDYDDLMIIRREISPAGKSRAFVNDVPVQLTVLKELGSRIIDIHSQHQTLTLGDRHFQLDLLDTFGEHPTLPASYREAYARYAALKRELEELMAQEAASRKEQDFLQFQWDELHDARLIDGEQEDLEQESALLNHTESIKEALTMVDQLCDGEESGAVERLRASLQQLSKVASCHSDIEQSRGRLDSVVIELRDILSDLASLNEKLTFSPERQQYVQDRLDLIYRLQKKHAVASVVELLAVQEHLDEQLQHISTLDDQIHRVMEEVDKAFGTMQQLADSLTEMRRKSASYLEQHILPILSSLNMKDSVLKVSMTPAAEYGPNGHDEVLLLFNANKGGELRELSKVASGGEMSRLMLAVKSLITQRSLLPTIIFDEIDTGISGDISVAVGNIMKNMSASMQVVAISHMPQIAAKAVQHLKVQKQSDADSTISIIRQLQPQERRVEIATMLSSDPPTASALKTAEELMQQ